MIPENFKTLIEKLKDKTAKKEAIWTKTSRDDEFKLDLEQGAITIDRWESSFGQSIVDIVVLNEHGDNVDSLELTISDNNDYEYLVELHNAAKRAYYKVDETFKSIFKELDSDKTIGKDKPSDGLPF